MTGSKKSATKSGPDTGTAYARPAPTWRKVLTDVGAGTPMGELLRRYWHPVGVASLYNGKTWPELTEEEHQRFPGDFETQTSQGAIAHHSEEHLALVRFEAGNFLV